jgi:hypothetical protein
MSYEIEHMGMLIECSVSAGSPGRYSGPPEDCYPAEPPEVEQLSVRVSDWDEFSDWWGAKGEYPTFATDLDALLEKVSEREWENIYDAALEVAEKDEPDYDYEPDDYYEEPDFF